MVKSEKIRWGILGTGNIAFKFRNGLRALDQVEATALCSRSEEKAAMLAKQHEIPKAYGHYEDMLSDPGVDVIYIATPHAFHMEHVLRALESGKPVLCEKSFTINAEQARVLIDKAREKKLFLMEAMWTRFLPAVAKVREWLASGAIGDIQMTQVNFGYFLAVRDPEHRMNNPLKGGGALLDIGVYCLSFMSMVMGGLPDRVQTSVSLGPTGVDDQYVIQLVYGDGRMGSIFGTLRAGLDNSAWIFGSRGKIRVPEFFSAKSAELIPTAGGAEVYKPEWIGNGYSHQAAEVGRCLRAGLAESSVMPLDETLRVMEAMDAIRKQWGLSYPCE